MKRAGGILTLLLVGGCVGWAIHRHFGRSRVPVPQAVLARDHPVMRFHDLSFEHAIREIERTAGLRIDVDWAAVGEDRRQLPVSIHRYDTKLRACLATLLSQVGSDASVIDGGDRIVIGSRNTEILSQQLRLYDVADLLRSTAVGELVDDTIIENPNGHSMIIHGILVNRSDVDETALRRMRLRDLIGETVDPASWEFNGGSVGASRYIGGRLAVVQTAENHAALAQLLEAVRALVARSDWPGTDPDDILVRRLLAKRLERELVIDGDTAVHALDQVREAFRANIELEEVPRSILASGRDRRIRYRVDRPTVEDALRSWADQVGIPSADVAFTVDSTENGLFVTTQSAAAQEFVTRAYDLRQLLNSTRPTADQLDELLGRLRELTGRESWRQEGGTYGAAQELFGGVLVITQTRENHVRMRRWLDAMLASKPATRPN